MGTIVVSPFRWSLVATVVLVAGASAPPPVAHFDDDDPSPSAGHRTLACSVTLTGSVTATHACTAGAAWDGTSNESLVTVTVGTSVNLIVKIRGVPAVRTYASSEDDSGAGMTVTEPSGAYWYFNRDFGAAGTPSGGSYELTLTEAAEAGGTDSYKGYRVAGSLTATLPAGALGGATGTVTATVTFD